MSVKERLTRTIGSDLVSNANDVTAEAVRVAIESGERINIVWRPLFLMARFSSRRINTHAKARCGTLRFTMSHPGSVYSVNVDWIVVCDFGCGILPEEIRSIGCTSWPIKFSDVTRSEVDCGPDRDHMLQKRQQPFLKDEPYSLLSIASLPTRCNVVQTGFTVDRGESPFE